MANKARPPESFVDIEFAKSTQMLAECLIYIREHAPEKHLLDRMKLQIENNRRRLRKS